MPGAFIKNILCWAEQEAPVGLVDELVQRQLDTQKAFPEKSKLWSSFLSETLPRQFQYLIFKYPDLYKIILVDLCRLPNFPKISKIQKLLENNMPGWACYSDKTAFCERISVFHNKLEHWSNGSIHAKYREDKIELLKSTQHLYHFPDTWSCARFLKRNGLPFPTGKKTYSCWKKYSKNKKVSANDYFEWLSLLDEVDKDWQKKISTDQRLELIFEQHQALGLVSLCENRSSCTYCPLCADCDFFKNHYSSDHSTEIKNQIRLKRWDEISKIDMLTFLSGEKCQFSKEEFEMFAQFPLTSSDVLSVDQDQHLVEIQVFLQGLVELFHRTKLDKYTPDGESFTDSRQIAKYVSQLLSRESQEFFYILILDNKNRVIRNHQVSMGLLNKSLVHPREVFAPALELRAASIVLVHNHPSGDTAPSIQDRNITRRLVEVGKIMGINVIDHLIIGDETYFSFVDQGIMPSEV